MSGSEELPSFIEYLSSAEVRFLQERSLVLDIYYSGVGGMAVVTLAIISGTVFSLALLQMISKRLHVVSLLIGLGVTSMLIGLLTSYLNFESLGAREAELLRDVAGPTPLTIGQESIVIGLPLIIGMLVLASNLAGCAYLSLFWGGSLIPRRKGSKAET